MSKNGVVNKTPDWYVEYKHETWTKYQEAATAVSPDMELAVKKAILLAKAKLVDRINGEVNNRTTINKNEAGTNESLTVTAGSQDIIVNIIGVFVFPWAEFCYNLAALRALFLVKIPNNK